MTARAETILTRAGTPPPLLQMPRLFTPLRDTLAANHIGLELAEQRDCSYLREKLARAQVSLIAEEIRDIPPAIARVKSFLTDPEVSRHPMAASICHQLDRQWLKSFPVSEQTPLPTMREAYLDHADWEGIDLQGAKLSGADLSFANLAGTCLKGAAAVRTNFHRAVLAQADLRGFSASEANFAQADLREVKAVSADFGNAVFHRAKLDGASFYHANLRQADFTGAALVKVLFRKAILHNVILTDADLRHADFTEAELDGADFRTAEIDGTCWHTSSLLRCNFEEVSATASDFSEADLTGALLTGSIMPDANFSDADLRDTGLAAIDWARANLQNADLRGASFHLGSSRSGLVGSFIALQGSMTGFYTDEFTEQDFKAPEEIRKANLRGADLRGANIEGVDFYLVDLRDAIYDEEQAAHFRACGAILHHRGE